MLAKTNFTGTIIRELSIMNQTIQIIFAVILIALSFIYPADADAEQKLSFQGVSYNNDIKPEQFNFSDVIIKVKSFTKRITFSAKFKDISTPYIASNQQNSFNINIDADPQTGVIYAFRLAADAFAQTIPDHFSYAVKPNNFLIAPMSIQDGKFTSLYNQLTNHDKTMLKGACQYFKNDNNIQTLLSVKAPTGNSILGQGTNKISELLSKPNIALQIKRIASLCFNATNRVYVKDVQTFLNASGHDVGKSDGQWGPKSQKGWEAYLTSQGKPLDTIINITSVQKLQKSISGKTPKLRKVTFKDGYFDINGSKHYHSKFGTDLCVYIHCKLTFNRWHNDAKKEIYEIQSSLNYAGFDAGVPNGLIGNKTLIAVKKYYLEKNKKFDGVLSENEFNEIVRYSSNPSFKIFNDFSRMIYKSGISIQPSGNYPSAVNISNGTAKFTLTPKMYSNYSKKHQRFEIGKIQIPEHLALRIKFKFKSDNKVSDRVLIAQIKSHQKRFGTVGPLAAVYIDRPPKCTTWNRNKYYPEKFDYYVDNPIQHSTKGLLVYSIKRKNGLYEYVWADRKKHEINRSYKPLNDGKWHDIEMHAYPHNKKGFCRIYIDGKLMLEINNAPTKSYVANYGNYAARIGIYRDAVNYDQTVEFDDFEIIGYKP